MLNKLNDNKIITYDVNSEDKEIQLLTNKTTELVKVFINKKLVIALIFHYSSMLLMKKKLIDLTFFIMTMKMQEMILLR